MGDGRHAQAVRRTLTEAEDRGGDQDAGEAPHLQGDADPDHAGDQG